VSSKSSIAKLPDGGLWISDGSVDRVFNHGCKSSYCQRLLGDQTLKYGWNVEYINSLVLENLELEWTFRCQWAAA
jgi:hypothetical protein